MFVRLEKINPEERQKRFYVMNVTRNLFGEWCLIREWGRIGSAGGQRLINYAETREDAEVKMDKLVYQKKRRGYCEPKPARAV